VGTPNGRQIIFVPGVARKIHLNVPSTDRIDGSFYADGSTIYLNIKRDGQCNEIWRSGSVYGPWKPVQDCLVRGNEGPNMVMYGGTYYLYTDRIAHWEGWRRPGVVVQRAPSPSGPWSEPEWITTYGRTGMPIPARQGSVIRYHATDNGVTPPVSGD